MIKILPFHNMNNARSKYLHIYSSLYQGTIHLSNSDNFKIKLSLN